MVIVWKRLFVIYALFLLLSIPIKEFLHRFDAIVVKSQNHIFMQLLFLEQEFFVPIIKKMRKCVCVYLLCVCVIERKREKNIRGEYRVEKIVTNIYGKYITKRQIVKTELKCTKQKGSHLSILYCMKLRTCVWFLCIRFSSPLLHSMPGRLLFGIPFLSFSISPSLSLSLSLSLTHYPTPTPILSVCWKNVVGKRKSCINIGQTFIKRKDQKNSMKYSAVGVIRLPLVFSRIEFDT